MNLLRRAVVLAAAAAMAGLVTATVSACGGATTTTITPSNGLEKKPAAEVLREAAAALKGAKSVHIVGTTPIWSVDIRIQDGSSTGTLTLNGARMKITIIGSTAYINTDQAGLKQFGASPQMQRQDAGRWLKSPSSGFKSFTSTGFASQLTSRHMGSVEPKVQQATLDGRKVAVISWRDGSRLDVANTGPAYPLRLTRPNLLQVAFSEYGARFRVAAPSNAINP